MRLRPKADAMAAWEQTAVTMNKGKSVAGVVLTMGAAMRSMNADKKISAWKDK